MIPRLKEHGRRRVQEVRALAWRKSGYSIGNGDCVEVAATRGTIAVRDSKDPVGPVVEYPVGAWHEFLATARRGGFDRPF